MFNLSTYYLDDAGFNSPDGMSQSDSVADLIHMNFNNHVLIENEKLCDATCRSPIRFGKERRLCSPNPYIEARDDVTKAKNKRFTRILSRAQSSK